MVRQHFVCGDGHALDNQQAHLLHGKIHPALSDFKKHEPAKRGDTDRRMVSKTGVASHGASKFNGHHAVQNRASPRCRREPQRVDGALDQPSPVDDYRANRVAAHIFNAARHESLRSLSAEAFNVSRGPSLPSPTSASDSTKPLLANNSDIDGDDKKPHTEPKSDRPGCAREPAHVRYDIVDAESNL